MYTNTRNLSQSLKIYFRLFLFVTCISSVSNTAYAQYILPENFNNLKKDTVKQEGENQEVQGTVFINISPGVKNGIFKNDGSVEYAVKVTNNYKVNQDGKLSCFVTTDEGEIFFKDSVKINLAKKSSGKYHFKIPCKQFGFYKVSFRCNLTFYDDTIKRVFGVNPQKIDAPLNKPDDFDEFWKKTRDTLEMIAPRYKIIEERALSINNKKVYLIEMHSWGNGVVRGWLTIPNNRSGKLPVKYRLPGYVVKMEPTIDDDDFAVFNFNVRGSGNSADAIDTHGEYNLYHVESRDKYVYRAVYMDCIRGLDFLSTHGNMGLDTGKILVDGSSQGGGLAIALAAMDKRVKAVTAQVPLYADFRKAYEITSLNPKSQTPVGMLVNYVKNHPHFTKEKLFKVWDYYDPMSFAPEVKCPVIMAIGLLDEFCPPQCSFALYNKLKNKRNEIWSSPDKTHEVDELYYSYQFLWFQDILRLP